MSDHNLGVPRAQKLVVTLGDAFASQSHMSNMWWDDFHYVSSNVRKYLRV